MEDQFFSIVIPAYKQAKYLADAIQSVLNQTYPHFELIVVDDCSPDGTEQVVKQFEDSRIIFLSHERNLGLSEARNTGIRASRGDMIALLDADDMFHPEKIQSHLDFLLANPWIGVSYNSRFELNHSASTIREIHRIVRHVGLEDLLLGFPFAPSDMVIRREWAFKVGMFSPEMKTAEDTDFPCRLALAGCEFDGIDRALNYRRYHSGRGRRNLQGRVDDVRRAQAAVFMDPRCPQRIRDLGPSAIKMHLLDIISLALIQEETALAHQFLAQLVDVAPDVVKGCPCGLVTFLLSSCIEDDSLDPEMILRRMFAQIPPFIRVSSQYNWALKRGWLWKAARAFIWGRQEAGQSYFDKAIELGSPADGIFLEQVTDQLIAYSKEFGNEEVLRILSDLAPYLNRLSGRAGSNLKSTYLVNIAFDRYHSGNRKSVPALVFEALLGDPSYITNRGVLSILMRSLAHSL